MPLTVGQTLQDRYRIDRHLGRGGMGAVYRGIDLTFDAPVAIKENQMVTRESEKQFAREAGLLYRLRHPNLPRVIDHFEIAGQGQYLVMDFVEGQDLQEILVERGKEQGRKLGAVSQDEALAWIGSVLGALEYLHGQNIIHRDVKPANVKITPEGQVFLVDFGLAKVFDPRQETTMGARGVTPGYSPPEQYGLRRTDARSDLYSAGATLYAMVAGLRPPDGPDLMTRQAELVPPRQVNPNVSPRVEAAILRAMQPAPDDRFQSAAELQAALPAPGSPRVPAIPIATVPPTAPFEPTVRDGGRPMPAWFWPVVGGIVALLVLVVVVVVAMVGGGGSGDPATETALPATAISGPTATLAITPAPPTGTPDGDVTALPPTETPAPTKTPTATATRPDATDTATPTHTPTPTRTPTPTVYMPPDLVITQARASLVGYSSGCVDHMGPLAVEVCVANNSPSPAPGFRLEAGSALWDVPGLGAYEERCYGDAYSTSGQAVADIYDQVSEADETNNTAFVPVPTQPPICTPPSPSAGLDVCVSPASGDISTRWLITVAGWDPARDSSYLLSLVGPTGSADPIPQTPPSNLEMVSCGGPAVTGFRFEFPLNGPFPAGTYQVIIEAQPSGETASGSFTLTP